MSGPRVGQGFDVHRFSPGGPLWLCGLPLDVGFRLEGHSDADVALHAVTDAVLGAAALGDIGEHFPPSDSRWAGAASRRFLEHAVALAAEAGFRLVNCDLTIIGERPRIHPVRGELRQSLAEILGLPLAACSVKATTTEGLGFTGRGEGLAAMAVVLLVGADD
jgi:2-C-methyl-D-erythritol 4-phosphate cytidylyltransferase/2-C-methyl-D-erythritol 2,4-cyclodiphosphate synthase